MLPPLDYKPDPTYQPVDGHHPNSVHCRIYPHLGRFLKETDIGTEFVRVYPYCRKNWSYIIDRPLIEHFKLIYITSQEIIFQKSYPQSPDSESEQLCLLGSWNDGYWTPAQMVVWQLKQDKILGTINDKLVFL